jgi:hypothetical protein
MDQSENGNACVEYFWCMFCERTYKKGVSRLVDGKEFCPYEACIGDVDLDSREWALIRVGRESRYPLIPEHGRVYPQYEV